MAIGWVFAGIFHGFRGNGAATRNVMLAGLGGILVFLSLSLVVTYGVLEIKTGLRAYVTGESLWAKGTEDGIHFLARYIETGEEHDLEQAREGLAIPMGDREGRLALEASPPNLDAARRGFLQGGNHPEDIARIVWLFQNFRELGHFQAAVSIWREADEYILRLATLLDSLEAGAVSDERLSEIEQEIIIIRSELRPLTEAFSQTLGSADRWLNGILFITVSVFLSLTAILAMAFFWWVTRRLTRYGNELRATLEHAAVGMALLYKSGHVQMFNSKFRKVLGLSGGKLNDFSLKEITAACDSGIDLEQICGQLETQSSEIVEERCLNVAGEEVWLRFRFSATGEKEESLDYCILVVEDVSEEHSRLDQLNYEATHDPLTGLVNRREFSRRMEYAIETVRAESARHVVCFMDLDEFKAVNDSCGHAVGDELLVGLSRVIRKQLREGDVLARLGGDEFGVIFSYCPMYVAIRIGDKIRSAVERFVLQQQGEAYRVTISLGLVGISPDLAHVAPENILEMADQACYQAKRKGRNTLHTAT